MNTTKSAFYRTNATDRNKAIDLLQWAKEDYMVDRLNRLAGELVAKLAIGEDADVERSWIRTYFYALKMLRTQQVWKNKKVFQ